MPSLSEPPRFPQTNVNNIGLRGLGLPEIAAAALSFIWIVAVLIYVFTAAPAEAGASLGWAMTLLVTLLPLVLIWVAVITLRAIAGLRAEAQRLQHTVEAMRSSYQETAQQLQVSLKPVIEQRSEDSARAVGPPSASFSTRRDSALSQPSADRKSVMTPARPEPEAEQPALALGTPAEAASPPLSIGDFITALQFPESPDDKAGFRSLRLALADREIAKLIRAAQDVLTLLSQEGIYMDDIQPELCHPELWRRFAAGERGPAVAVVGGIHDRASLALTAGRMREDTIFRDAAHHFLRTFDRMFQSFEKHVSDAEVMALADSRTARAFMLVGRVSGVFD